MSQRTGMGASLETLLAAGQVDEAVALAEELHASRALDAVTADWLLSEARGWHAHGLMAEQKTVCEIMLAFFPEHCEALHLLGHQAQAQGDFGRAEAYYVRALAAKPDYAFARLALAQLQMMRSDFLLGREGYEARFDAVTEDAGPDWRELPIPRWRGEALADKQIYIWAEQGLGDIVMFARFLPQVLAQAPKRVALGMFPKLTTLFQRSFPQIAVESSDDAIYHALAPSAMQVFPHIERLAGQVTLPFSLAPLKAAHDYAQAHGRFDFACPMGDLMVYLMTAGKPSSHPVAYLAADPDRVAATRARLSALGCGRRIGIAWHTTNRREWMRNISLEEWLPLLRTEGCHFISLQHHMDRQDIQRFCKQHGCHITVDDTVDLLTDAEGLAALIASMDEVITIDNSTVHLAGALGIPATLLLPTGHNYRWPKQQDGGTLWYQSVQVLRQHEPFNWLPVMAEAAMCLKNRIAV